MTWCLLEGGVPGRLLYKIRGVELKKALDFEGYPYCGSWTNSEHQLFLAALLLHSSAKRTKSVIHHNAKRGANAGNGITVGVLH